MNQGYCCDCGQYIGKAPFHAHDWQMCLKDPRSPYCGDCGKTVREGFIKRVTCQCGDGSVRDRGGA